MTDTKKARQNFVDAVTHRVEEAETDLRAVAKKGGISYETVRRGLNNPEKMTPYAIKGIERGLDWPAGGVTEALAGKQPTPLTPPELPSPLPPPSPWAQHAIVVRPDLIASKTPDEIKTSVDLVKATMGAQAAADFLVALGPKAAADFLAAEFTAKDGEQQPPED